MHPHLPLDMLLPRSATANNTDSLETFNDLSFILPHPASETEILSLSVLWVRVSATTLTLLTSAIHSLNTDVTLPDGQDVVMTAMLKVLEEEGARERVVYQPGEWYGLSSQTKEREERERAVFWQPGAGSAFEKLRELEGMIAEIRTKRRDETDTSSLEKEVVEWWDKTLEARRA